jgi:hypothetical protein
MGGDSKYDPANAGKEGYVDLFPTPGNSETEMAKATPDYRPGYGNTPIDNEKWDSYAMGRPDPNDPYWDSTTYDPFAGGPADERSWRDFMVGRDPNYVDDQSAMAARRGAMAEGRLYNLGDQSAASGERYAGNLEGMAGDIYKRAGGMYDVAAPQARAQTVGVTNTGDYSTSDSDFTRAGQYGRNMVDQAALASQRGQAYGESLIGQANQATGESTAYGRNLASLEAQQGPSAAQAQLQLGANASMDQAMALARSGRGYGGSSQGIADAQRANASTMANVSNQAAMLRAQEDAAWRQRQAANLGTAAGINASAAGQYANTYGQAGQINTAGTQGLNSAYGNAAAINTAAGQQHAQNAQFGAQQQNAMSQFNAQQAQQSDQYNVGAVLTNRNQQNTAAGNLYNVAAGAQKSAGETAAEGYKSAGAMTATGASLGQAGQSVGVDLAKAQNATDLYREGMLTQEYGIASGIGIANDQAATQREAADKAAAGAVVAAGVTALSDVRAKQGVAPQEVDLRPARSYNYAYKDPQRVGAGPGRYSGPMAQDLLKSRGVEGSVVKQPDGMLGVDADRLSMSTASAVGQEQARVDSLEQRFAELESMLNNFDAKKRKPKSREVDYRSLDRAYDAPDRGDPYGLAYAGDPYPKAAGSR